MSLMGEACSHTTRYRVDGLGCVRCALAVDEAVARVPGVLAVSVSLAAGTMEVTCRGGAEVDAAVLRRIGDLGRYRVTALGRTGDDEPAGCATSTHGRPGRASRARRVPRSTIGLAWLTWRRHVGLGRLVLFGIVARAASLVVAWARPQALAWLCVGLAIAASAAIGLGARNRSRDPKRMATGRPGSRDRSGRVDLVGLPDEVRALVASSGRCVWHGGPHVRPDLR